jgi:MFS family permease
MTAEQRWLSRRYLLYSLFSNMWFMGAVWLYLYRLFITDQQVGILDGMAFAIGLVAEIPSGALADKFGRDRLVRAGQITVGAGLLLQAVGSSFMPFVVGQAITMVGAALISGADEALFFERLHFDSASKQWRKFVTRGSQAALIGSLFALVVGGWAEGISPRLPWILAGVIFIFTAVLIWPVKDTRPRAARGAFAIEVASYLENIKVGFRQFHLPQLWLYIPIILTVQGLFYATGWGLLRLILLSRFHFSPFWGSLAVASSSLITVGILTLMHRKADSLSEKQVLTYISLGAAASLLLSLADIGWWGYVVILMLYAGEHALSPFMSEILNNHAPEDQRATILSVSSLENDSLRVFGAVDRLS